MNNASILIKVKQRLNKLDSNDYDNIECWQIVEAYNKAQIEWCRRQLVGTNILRQGDEQSKRRVDDLQVLLTSEPVQTSALPLYEETTVLPPDYLAFKKIELYAINDCCSEPRLMTVYLGEEDNAINYLKDVNKKPSFEWGETFITLVGGNIRIYTGGDFKVSLAKLMYYKRPVAIKVAGCLDLETQLPATTEILSDLKDDIIEVVIDDTVAILGGDIESFNQASRESQAAEKNN